jgi:hypothetical protein
MKPLRRILPSPAMVVACIALTVALGGTSYAAIKLPRNSVGTKQLKKNAVTTLKVKNNAITSPKVKNNAITGADVLESSLGQVPSAATAAPSGAAGGSLAGTYPAPTLAPNAVTAAAVLDAAQATGLRKADIGAVTTTANVDPPNIAAGSCSSDSVPIPGAVTNDVVVAHPVNSVWSNLMYAVWLAQTDLVSFRICNPTGAAIDGPALPFHFLLIR